MTRFDKHQPGASSFNLNVSDNHLLCRQVSTQFAVGCSFPLEHYANSNVLVSILLRHFDALISDPFFLIIFHSALNNFYSWILLSVVARSFICIILIDGIILLVFRTHTRGIRILTKPPKPAPLFLITNFTYCDTFSPRRRCRALPRTTRSIALSAQFCHSLLLDNCTIFH